MPGYLANLGTTGISDLGVQEIDDSGTETVARTEVGVSELGTTGIYHYEVTPNASTAFLIWTATASGISAANGIMDVDVDSILTDTGTTIPATITTAQNDLDILTGADGVNLLSTTQASIDAIETDTNALNDTKVPDTISLANINAQVADVLKTDTMTQSTLCPQEAPPVNATIEEAIAYLYKAWRNKSTQDATTYSLFADDTTTVDHKATVSESGGTVTKGEVATGP